MDSDYTPFVVGLAYTQGASLVNGTFILAYQTNVADLSPETTQETVYRLCTPSGARLENGMYSHVKKCSSHPFRF